jgi:uncharacterized protein YndB with AHSA1/START domain
MKWLLYVLAGVVALVVLAVVVLLAVSRGDSRLTASVDVAQPAPVVFSFITEPERVKGWLSWLVEIRAVTPHRRGLGAREVWVMEDRNNNNQLMEIHAEIVGYEQDHRLTTRVTAAEGFVGTVDYALEPIDATHTRLRYEAAYTFHHWLARLLEPVITRSAQQKLEEDLARLKQQAEAAVPVAQAH